jgi:hypothetical protein
LFFTEVIKREVKKVVELRGISSVVIFSLLLQITAPCAHAFGPAPSNDDLNVSSALAALNIPHPPFDPNRVVDSLMVIRNQAPFSDMPRDIDYLIEVEHAVRGEIPSHLRYIADDIAYLHANNIPLLVTVDSEELATLDGGQAQMKKLPMEFVKRLEGLDPYWFSQPWGTRLTITKMVLVSEGVAYAAVILISHQMPPLYAGLAAVALAASSAVQVHFNRELWGWIGKRGKGLETPPECKIQRSVACAKQFGLAFLKWVPSEMLSLLVGIISFGVLGLAHPELTEVKMALPTSVSETVALLTFGAWFLLGNTAEGAPEQAVGSRLVSVKEGLENLKFHERIAKRLNEAAANRAGRAAVPIYALGAALMCALLLNWKVSFIATGAIAVTGSITHLYELWNPSTVFGVSGDSGCARPVMRKGLFGRLIERFSRKAPASSLPNGVPDLPF